MRIHTNDADTVQAAIRDAAASMRGVDAEISAHGSRKRRTGLELSLTGTGRAGGQYGNGSGKSATWDEWGAVLGAVFAADPDAIAGPYDGGEHFGWSTGHAYGGGLPEDAHHQHRWDSQGRSVTGSYFVSRCGRCSRIQRRMADGRSFAEIAGA